MQVKETANQQTSRHDRTMRALELRRSGMSYYEISKATGIKGKGQVHRLITRALRETLREPAEECRKLELDRIDELTMAHWHKAKEGDNPATKTVMELMDRRCKLLGIDLMPPMNADMGPMLRLVVTPSGQRIYLEQGQDLPMNLDEILEKDAASVDSTIAK